MIGQDGLQYAGAFKLSECKLITHTGPEVDLTQVITEVNIYEELQSHSLSADITFFDDKDAVSFYPIVGNEYVRLKIGTPDRTGDGQINFTKHTFVVYKISILIFGRSITYIIAKDRRFASHSPFSKMGCSILTIDFFKCFWDAYKSLMVNVISVHSNTNQ